MVLWVLDFGYLLLYLHSESLVLTFKSWIMYKIWNGKKLFDGHFYRVVANSSGDYYHYVLCFRYLDNGFIMNHYTNVDIDGRDYFNSSICCNNDEIVSASDATKEDIDLFFDILDGNGLRFDLNRKKLVVC